MNPEEDENEIVDYEQDILEPSFGRAQPSYPLKIGKCEYIQNFKLIKQDFITQIASF